MNTPSDRVAGRSLSLWMDTAPAVSGSKLTSDHRADVCIVGGGMAGISTAYALAKEGKKVVVLDDAPLADAQTERTTAHLVFYNDDGLSVIEKMHGTEGLKLSTESHSAAVDRIEQNVKDEEIDCDFQRTEGYLFVSPEGQGPDFLENELDAAHRIGLTDAKWVERAPIPSFDTGRCLCYPRQAMFHPLKYLNGLSAAFLKLGGQIFHEARVVKVTGGSPARIETKAGQVVTADAVVVATNTPINDFVAIHTKQSAWRTYAISFRIPRGAVPVGLYWDTEDPYHYVRPHPVGDHDELIVGGEDHKTGQASDADQRWRNLEKWARERFPMIEKVEHCWSGQVMEPMDAIGFVGRNPGDEPNVYIVTGDSGMGMTNAHVASILITDLIQGRSNPWEKIYDPARVKLSMQSIKTYVKDNAEVAAKYADWVKPGQVKEVSEIAPGTGAILQDGMKKLAVYRDDAGQTHECSAVCTHLGCIVAWNYGEKTWDCPCHGSRFDPYGRVIEGRRLRI